MKNRFIGENIRLIDCIIQYAAKENIPGLLLFMDFEKAFDSLEWSFIVNSLRFFGFGPSIIKGGNPKVSRIGRQKRKKTISFFFHQKNPFG